MREIKIIITLFFLIANLISADAVSQTVTSGQFILRGNGDDFGNTLELLDGNFLYVGATTTHGNGARDIIVVKFAQDFQDEMTGEGNQEVLKTYKGTVSLFR